MGAAPDILRKILQHKREVIRDSLARMPLDELNDKIADSPRPRGFVNAVKNTIAEGHPAIIAEAKKASPSKGVIRENFDIAQIARSYQQGGATCMSVLTDERFFQGRNEYLEQARTACQLPLIRKDFIIHPYQVLEARALGADCILLIAAALQDEQLHELTELATELQLDVLTEAHNAAELQRCLPLNLPLVGINNRNLHTFKTDLRTTLDLLPQIPPNRIVVTESGIDTTADVQLMRDNEVSAFLIGEALMREQEPGKRIGALFG